MANEYLKNIEGIHDIRALHAHLGDFWVMFLDGYEVGVFGRLRDAYYFVPFAMRTCAGRGEYLSLMAYFQGQLPHLKLLAPVPKIWPSDAKSWTVTVDEDSQSLGDEDVALLTLGRAFYELWARQVCDVPVFLSADGTTVFAAAITHLKNFKHLRADDGDATPV